MISASLANTCGTNCAFPIALSPQTQQTGHMVLPWQTRNHSTDHSDAELRRQRDDETETSLSEGVLWQEDFQDCIVASGSTILEVGSGVYEAFEGGGESLARMIEAQVQQQRRPRIEARHQQPSDSSVEEDLVNLFLQKLEDNGTLQKAVDRYAEKHGSPSFVSQSLQAATRQNDPPIHSSPIHDNMEPQGLSPASRSSMPRRSLADSTDSDSIDPYQTNCNYLHPVQQQKAKKARTLSPRSRRNQEKRKLAPASVRIPTSQARRPEDLPLPRRPTTRPTPTADPIIQAMSVSDSDYPRVSIAASHSSMCNVVPGWDVTGPVPSPLPPVERRDAPGEAMASLGAELRETNNEPENLLQDDCDRASAWWNTRQSRYSSQPLDQQEISSIQTRGTIGRSTPLPSRVTISPSVAAAYQQRPASIQTRPQPDDVVVDTEDDGCDIYDKLFSGSDDLVELIASPRSPQTSLLKSPLSEASAESRLFDCSPRSPRSPLSPMSPQNIESPEATSPVYASRGREDANLELPKLKSSMRKKGVTSGFASFIGLDDSPRTKERRRRESLRRVQGKVAKSAGAQKKTAPHPKTASAPHETKHKTRRSCAPEMPTTGFSCRSYIPDFEMEYQPPQCGLRPPDSPGGHPTVHHQQQSAAQKTKAPHTQRFTPSHTSRQHVDEQSTAYETQHGVNTGPTIINHYHPQQQAPPPQPPPMLPYYPHMMPPMYSYPASCAHHPNQPSYHQCETTKLCECGRPHCANESGSEDRTKSKQQRGGILGKHASCVAASVENLISGNDDVLVNEPTYSSDDSDASWDKKFQKINQLRRTAEKAKEKLTRRMRTLSPRRSAQPEPIDLTGRDIERAIVEKANHRVEGTGSLYFHPTINIYNGTASSGQAHPMESTLKQLEEQVVGPSKNENRLNSSENALVDTISTMSEDVTSVKGNRVKKHANADTKSITDEKKNDDGQPNIFSSTERRLRDQLTALKTRASLRYEMGWRTSNSEQDQGARMGRSSAPDPEFQRAVEAMTQTAMTEKPTTKKGEDIVEISSLVAAEDDAIVDENFGGTEDKGGVELLYVERGEPSVHVCTDEGNIEVIIEKRGNLFQPEESEEAEGWPMKMLKGIDEKSFSPDEMAVLQKLFWTNRVSSEAQRFHSMISAHARKKDEIILAERPANAVRDRGEASLSSVINSTLTMETHPCPREDENSPALMISGPQNEERPVAVDESAASSSSSSVMTMPLPPPKTSPKSSLSISDLSRNTTEKETNSTPPPNDHSSAIAVTTPPPVASSMSSSSVSDLPTELPNACTENEKTPAFLSGGEVVLSLSSSASSLHTSICERKEEELKTSELALARNQESSLYEESENEASDASSDSSVKASSESDLSQLYVRVEPATVPYSPRVRVTPLSVTSTLHSKRSKTPISKKAGVGVSFDNLEALAVNNCPAPSKLQESKDKDGTTSRKPSTPLTLEGADRSKRLSTASRRVKRLFKAKGGSNSLDSAVSSSCNASTAKSLASKTNRIQRKLHELPEEVTQAFAHISLETPVFVSHAFDGISISKVPKDTSSSDGSKKVSYDPDKFARLHARAKKKLTRSLPLTARERCSASALPGSLLWQANGDSSSEEISARATTQPTE